MSSVTGEHPLQNAYSTDQAVSSDHQTASSKHHEHRLPNALPASKASPVKFPASIVSP